MKKLLILLLISLLVMSTGCYNLRKKFIRKKKIKDDQPVYVNFKEYPEKPSRSAYVDYYIFTRGWLAELIDSLNKGLSYKRDKRAINQAIHNVEQIISFYNPEGRDKLYPLYEALVTIREAISRSPNMSTVKRNSTVRKIEVLKRRFEKDFNYRDAEKWMN